MHSNKSFTKNAVINPSGPLAQPPQAARKANAAAPPQYPSWFRMNNASRTMTKDIIDMIAFSLFDSLLFPIPFSVAEEATVAVAAEVIRGEFKKFSEYLQNFSTESAARTKLWPMVIRPISLVPAKWH